MRTIIAKWARVLLAFYWWFFGTLLGAIAMVFAAIATENITTMIIVFFSYILFQAVATFLYIAVTYGLNQLAKLDKEK